MFCPVCQTRCNEYSTHAADSCRFDCKRCGEFDISGTAMAVLQPALESGVHRRALMSHTIRRMTGFGKNVSRPMIVSDKLESYWPGERLPAPGLQADSLILLLGDLQLSPDEDTRVAGAFLAAWLGTSLSSPTGGVNWVMTHLRDSGLLTWNWEDAFGDNPIYLVALTMYGWQKYEALKQLPVNSRTAFMAMKFGDAQLDQVVDQCFRPAVRRTGFELKKLTDEQPAGLIDDQIRASLFVWTFCYRGSYPWFARRLLGGGLCRGPPPAGDLYVRGKRMGREEDPF